MEEHARFEIFTRAERAETVVAAILDAASTGTRGDGIVCLPAEGQPTAAAAGRIWRQEGTHQCAMALAPEA